MVCDCNCGRNGKKIVSIAATARSIVFDSSFLLNQEL